MRNKRFADSWCRADYVYDYDYCMIKESKEGLQNLLDQFNLDTAFVNKKCEDLTCLQEKHWVGISYTPIYENLNANVVIMKF